jgi:hypothetical protein
MGKKNIKKVLADTLSAIKISDQDIDTFTDFRDLMPEQKSELIELVYALSIALFRANDFSIDE